MDKVDQDTLGNTLDHNYDNLEKAHNVSINHLPTEILVLIFSQLDPIYLNNLRLVCKKWNFVINDKDTWMRSFIKRFNLPSNLTSFPSLTNSNNWMNEYFTRIKITRSWKKSASTHHTYQLLNNEYKFVDSILYDFSIDKICLFDKRSCNLTSGSLINGKNQSFIPGGYALQNDKLMSYSLNWNYLIIGTIRGDLYLKNLITSTSVSSRLSLIKFENEDSEPITDVVLNPYPDKSRSNLDCMSGSSTGKLNLWNLQGKLLKTIQLKDEIIYNIKSDFNKFIIVNTVTSIYIINYTTFEILCEHEIGFDIDTDTVHIEERMKEKNTLDVDYGSKSIILNHKNKIKLFNFKNLKSIKERLLVLENDVRIVDSQFQSTTQNKFLNKNDSIIGHDGLFYGNLLSDSSILIWNVREESLIIDPIIRFHPDLNHKKLSIGLNNAIIRSDLMDITSFAFNSSIIAVGGYNGLTNIYDVFTGKFLREVSIKLPKRYNFLHENLVPINFIKLNPNNGDMNGIIVCADVVQYFQFGERITVPIKKKKLSKVNTGSNNKSANQKKIKDGIDEYDRQLHQSNETDRLFDRYNGTSFDNEEDEYKMALAISESFHSNNNSVIDDDFERILELSRHDNISENNSEELNKEADISNNGGLHSEDFDEELRMALELSMIEH